jgi:hypothetical protein
MTDAAAHPRQAQEPLAGIACRRSQSFAELWDRLESQFGIFRLVVTVVGLGTLVGVFSRLSPWASVASIFALVAGFLILSALHRILRRRRELWFARRRSFAAQRARLRRDFVHLLRGSESDALLAPWTHELMHRALPPGHPFALDLDVQKLVFPLLDTCATPEASEQLLGMLLQECPSPSAAAEAQQRRERVFALRRYPRLLRDLDASRFMPEVASSWVQGKACRLVDLEALLAAQRAHRKTLVYVGFGVVSVVAWLVLLLPAHRAFFASGATEEYLGSLLRYAILPLAGLAIFRSLFDAASALRRRMTELDLVMRELDALKDEPSLKSLHDLASGARRRLGMMRAALDLYGARTNPVFWLFVHVLVPYDALLGLVVWFMMHRMSHDFSPLIKGISEFDCDAALARFARENPEFVFSTVASPRTTASALTIEDMGHPLLPGWVRVCNSIAWKHEERIVILTGSNMSGKSTFLRTLGVNALLHNIGAPVCAKSFVAPPLKLQCAIRVDDDLEAGTSYFYAEVKRLASMLKDLRQSTNGSATKSALTVYLIDEIFRGTNNRERFLGSLYVLKGFMATDAIGLVTTHDLALTRLASIDDATHARNMHFRETIARIGNETRLEFDYRLREGPCPTTNALRIMHAEGLPVPAEIPPEVEAALLAAEGTAGVTRS